MPRFSAIVSRKQVYSKGEGDIFLYFVHFSFDSDKIQYSRFSGNAVE